MLTNFHTTLMFYNQILYFNKQIMLNQEIVKEIKMAVGKFIITE